MLLAAEAQILLDEDRTEDLAVLAADWKKQETAVPPGPGLFPHALRVLSKLEALDGDWRELLHRAEEAPPAAVPETLLERLGTYFAFRYLLKAVNDGDPAGAGAVLRADGPDGTAPDGSMWLLGGCPPPLL